MLEWSTETWLHIGVSLLFGIAVQLYRMSVQLERLIAAVYRRGGDF
jgi:hypothetical protein